MENYGRPAQQTGTIYRQFLSQLRQLTGAAASSLYIDAASDPGSAALLIHSDHTESAPEFESIVLAQDAIDRLTNLGGRKAPGIQVFPSAAENCCLVEIRVGEESAMEAPDRQQGNERRHDGSLPDIAGTGALWVGLRYEEGSVPLSIMELDTPGIGIPGSEADWLSHCLITSARLVWEANRIQLLLRDPTSQLPGRAEFQARLKLAIDECRGKTDFGLLLVNPDEFDMVNRRLGRDSGDAALAQVASMLCDSLRRTDGIYRYGGAVFAVHMPGVNRDTLVTVAEKIRESLTGAYLSGAMRLSFSVGAALYNPSLKEDQALDDLGLLRRADQALNAAKGRGGDCSVMWHPGDAEQQLICRDRLSGIFTANVEKDYRNMLILWDIIGMISDGGDEVQLATGFIEKIQLAMRPTWAALFANLEGNRARLLAQSGRARFPEGQYPREIDHLLKRAWQAGRAERHRREPGTCDRNGGEWQRGYAIPLKAGDRWLACLYLEGPVSEPALDSSDLVFLNALAGQLALALDRADLAARWRADQERESRRLRNEVQGLRQAMQSTRLVYHSLEFDAVLETARAAAPTDVTVLIRGESGTGKEMLARAVHEMSNRKGKPFVTVDCGSIAPNLIEAELFGALKGAFTGADKASTGRIVQADGGTLFLDEIGEVPLDVQAKLLRFVQEKEIHPVGASTSRRVDVRIVAATNRDLVKEAASGRFREDLYFRLNVVTLVAPPLRGRPDDILPLAGHFLERFALQYDKGPRRFSPGAEQSLLSYHWPGNVRELQNGILRAVVLSTEEVIDETQLHFEEDLNKQALTNPRVLEGKREEPTEPRPEPARDFGDPWHELGIQLDRQVDAALHHADKDAVPLGRWLSEDLVLTLDEKAQGTARRAARRLGVAETTYRRKLEKAKRLRAQGLDGRTETWSRLKVYIEHLTNSLDEDNQTNVMETARNRLLAAVAARVGTDDAAGSALMGITVPTYRRWLEQI